MAPTSDERIYAELGTVYRSVKGLDRELRPDLRLREDLDLDSLDAVEMVTELEDRLGEPLLERVGEHLGEVEKVSDLVAVLAPALE